MTDRDEYLDDIRGRLHSYRPLIDRCYRTRVSGYTHPDPQRLALELVDDLDWIMTHVLQEPKEGMTKESIFEWVDDVIGRLYKEMRKAQ